MTDLKYLITLTPEKAIKYLKDKGYEFTWDWHDIWQDAHTRSFVVAKVMRKDILQDIREIVEKAMEKGLTFQQFKKELEPKLKNKGWWGKVWIGDGSSAETVQLGSVWRLKTIYRTNIQTSYMAGRYREQIDNIDNRPYWQYVAVMDRRTRPAHSQLNGRIFSYDDPFWDSFYPPNGWGCRCRVRALSDENIKERDLGVDKSDGQLSEELRLVSKKTGELRPVAVYTDPLTEHKIAPDVGWSYNPGRLKDWRQNNDN
ncbi:MAG: phage minor head protein [Candidatus Gastranaerophilales bacterium]|nr:phage minor head protein [Candidatus Gastranaerophilales bacterium]